MNPENHKIYDNILGKILASNAVADALFIIRDELCLGNVTYHLAFNVGARLDNPYVRTTYPTEWVSSYLLNNYVEIDPVVKHGVQANAPFFWDEIIPDQSAERIFADAQKFGIGFEGYSVPFTDDKGRKSLFSVTSQPDCPDWHAEVSAREEIFDHLARDIHSKALSEFFTSEADIPHLAPREVECLYWSAEGKSYSEIALILELSEHTVRSYLKSVRMRLNCVSLAQAVNKATKLRII